MMTLLFTWPHLWLKRTTAAGTSVVSLWTRSLAHSNSGYIIKSAPNLTSRPRPGNFKASLPKFVIIEVSLSLRPVLEDPSLTHSTVLLVFCYNHQFLGEPGLPNSTSFFSPLVSEGTFWSYVAHFYRQEARCLSLLRKQQCQRPLTWTTSTSSHPLALSFLDPLPEFWGNVLLPSPLLLLTAFYQVNLDLLVSRGFFLHLFWKRAFGNKMSS